MSTTTLTSSRTPARQAMKRPQPLLSVLTWELRRFLASRLFWIQALCFFVLLLFIRDSLHQVIVTISHETPGTFDSGPGKTSSV